MKENPAYDIIKTSPNGWIACPKCGHNHLKQIFPDERCERLRLYCRYCKQPSYVTIHDGQCFQSQGL